MLSGENTRWLRIGFATPGFGLAGISTAIILRERVGMSSWLGIFTALLLFVVWAPWFVLASRFRSPGVIVATGALMLVGGWGGTLLTIINWGDGDGISLLYLSFGYIVLLFSFLLGWSQDAGAGGKLVRPRKPPAG